MLGKGILVFFLCLYVETTCHSIPIGCNGTTDSIALSLAQSLQGIAKALQVCHENCYIQTHTIPHGQIKDTIAKRMTTSYKGSNPMGDTSFYKSCSRSFSLILYLLYKHCIIQYCMSSDL